MKSHHSAPNTSVETLVYSVSHNEASEIATGPNSSFPGRLLPPLNSVVSSQPAPSEGALSPHSTTHHYSNQNSPDVGYFPSTISHPYSYGQHQQSYQPHGFASSQQMHGHGYDTLLSFAEVAMGTATPGGRRTLEVEAATEAASRRGSGGSLRLCDAGVCGSSSHIMGQSTMATSSRVDRLDGSQLFQVDIEYVSAAVSLFSIILGFVCADIRSPELRPASAGSVASTGRTIEEETSMISIGDTRSRQSQRYPTQSQRSSAATQTIDSLSNQDTPLFRPTPEVATPRQEPVTISTDSGPSNASTGPLHIPSSPHDFLNQAPKCSYCSVCTTGSPLRKVVSHIFGRNKLSTRQIPKNVWVYYCRKHYQRSRYRNPRGFARQQVLLVRRQCERLELWGGVKDWVIKVRRREELRMNREGGDNGDDMDEVEDEVEDNTGLDDEMEPNDGGPTSGESSRRNSTVTTRRRSSTGGNNWIMRHTGMEKTISDIYRLLERIEVEVQENGGKFPDVELLPNVDLAMAVPIRASDGDGDEGGNGNTGGDENQEGADDEGVAGRTTGKKRRRSDGGSGSSGGDDANSKGTKKAKTAAVKKGGDRKGKGKAPSHMEAISDEKVLSQSTGAHEFQGAYQRAFSPEAFRQHEVDGMADSSGIQEVAVFTGSGFEKQIITPPSSTSVSLGRSTPEIDTVQSSTPGSYVLSPRRPTRIPPSTVITKPTCQNSFILSCPKSYTDLTPRELAAIAGEPLHRFPLRRPDASAFEDLVPKSSPGKIGAKPGLFNDRGDGQYAGFRKSPEILQCITVAKG